MPQAMRNAPSTPKKGGKLGQGGYMYNATTSSRKRKLFLNSGTEMMRKSFKTLKISDGSAVERTSTDQSGSYEKRKVGADVFEMDVFDFLGPNSNPDEKSFFQRVRRRVDSRRRIGDGGSSTSTDTSSNSSTDRCGQSGARSGKVVMFSSVGGHSETIRSLKESILFPLLYPNIFDNYNIKAPRGVLFYGPPGTGKTLLAHALAVECSTELHKVSFYSRKGADILSKYFGESEKHLKELFEEAASTAPSIIFFDEIDGLTPARSIRAENTHNTIVTTLLGLMDGLDSAAGVIVIGATNRIDTIDPALRRPGRFDREFYFGLPNAEARESILTIHTREWRPAVGSGLIKELALQTKGFCGADLQALCREAVIYSFKRKHPQIYDTKRRFPIDASSVEVTADDFNEPLHRLTPAALRSGSMGFAPIPWGLRPLFERRISDLNAMLMKRYPSLLDSSADPTNDPTLHNPRVLICEPEYCGYDLYVAPGILRSLDLNVQCINPATMYDPLFGTAEEALSTFFKQAQREVPSVIYMKSVNVWWNSLQESVQSIIVSSIRSMSSTRATLLLVTCSCEWTECPECVRSWFIDSSQIIVATPATANDKKAIFEQAINKDAFIFKPVCVKETPLLDDDQSDQGNPTDNEQMWKIEEPNLLAFRIACRNMISQLSKDTRFFLFKSAVPFNVAEDYYKHIKSPMDFSLIMSKIDRHNYFGPGDIFGDLELIVQNALYYNTDGLFNDRGARHKASLLSDTIQSLRRKMFRDDVERNLAKIHESRRKRGAVIEVPAICSIFLSTQPVKGNSASIFVRYDPIVPKNTNLRFNHGVEGVLSSDHPNFKKIMTIEAKQNKAQLLIEVIPKQSKTQRKTILTHRQPTPKRSESKKTPVVSGKMQKRADKTIDSLLKLSKTWNLNQMEKLLAAIHQQFRKYINVEDKSNLFNDLDDLVQSKHLV